MKIPRIAITMGDAAGVGPEIVMKSLAHAEVYAMCRPLVIGDAERLREAGRICGSRLSVPGDVECIDLKLIPKDLAWGRLSAAAGEGAFQFVKLATKLAMEGRVEAICTAPLNKEALHAAGHFYPGHTELLADLTGTPEVSMMLTAPNLRVIHVTAHMGLLDAIARIEPGLVERTITRGHEVLARAGLARRGGIKDCSRDCGVPHQRHRRGRTAVGRYPVLSGGVRGFRNGGGDVSRSGPRSGEGARAGCGSYITVGLPVIRTSVDHGTAFDIAGTGRTDERSMLEALRQAAELAGVF